MDGFRESFTPEAHRARRGGSLGRKVLSLLAIGGFAGAGSGCVATYGEGGAAEPQIPPPIETSYVGLMELVPDELATPTEALTVDLPSEEPVAAAYSRRYRISPELALEIVESAVEEGVDPDLAFRLVRVESVFKVSARGPQGALGLTQLMPGTARAIDRTLDTESEILQPEKNLRAGFRYLRTMIERYDDVRLGLLAYNRGLTAVDRALRRGADPENGYSHKVLGTRGSDPYSGPGLLSGPPGAGDG